MKHYPNAHKQKMKISPPSQKQKRKISPNSVGGRLQKKCTRRSGLDSLSLSLVSANARNAFVSPISRVLPLSTTLSNFLFLFIYLFLFYEEFDYAIFNYLKFSAIFFFFEVWKFKDWYFSISIFAFPAIIHFALNCCIG